MVEEESQLSSEPRLPFLWNLDVRDLKISISLAHSAGVEREDTRGLYSRPRKGAELRQGLGPSQGRGIRRAETSANSAAIKCTYEGPLELSLLPLCSGSWAHP